jgi:hemolysin III
MDLLHPREPVSTWSHGLWLAIALGGILLLWRSGRADRTRQITMLIYGLTLVFCSGCSTLFHGVRLPDDRIRPFALLDYTGIYMLIAGTYTPIAWTFLRRHWRWSVLSLVWIWAAMGISIHLARATTPLWLSTSLYLVMGWGAIFCYIELTRRLSHRELLPVIAGGVLYSLGAIINLLHAPVLWPGVFEAHELFHILVVAGSLCHFYFILTVVGPSAVCRKSSPQVTASFETAAASSASLLGGLLSDPN